MNTIGNRGAVGLAVALLIGAAGSAAAQIDVTLLAGLPALPGGPLAGTLDASGNPVELRERSASFPIALGLRFTRGLSRSGRLAIEVATVARTERVLVRNVRAGDPFYQAAGNGQLSGLGARLVFRGPRLFVAAGPGVMLRWGNAYSDFSGRLSPTVSLSTGIRWRVGSTALRAEIEDIASFVKLASPDATFERRVQHMLVASVGVTIWRLP